MKKELLLLAALAVSAAAHSQNRHTTSRDTNGVVTTWETHWSRDFAGRYKSVYDKKANVRTLVPRPPTELADQTARTAQRILVKKSLGQPFPAFQVTDYTGRVFDSKQLQGKVIVLNFWFVGCAPCEVEMAELNRLHAKYQSDPNVVFVSLVHSPKEVVETFLATHPFTYPIVALDKPLLALLKPAGYPTNVVLDKAGRYAYESVGAGVGAVSLLGAAIEKAAHL